MAAPPTLADWVGYWISNYGPVIGVPILEGVRRGYKAIRKIEDLMEKQNQLLTKLLDKEK
jgi:hypothetical protein